MYFSILSFYMLTCCSTTFPLDLVAATNRIVHPISTLTPLLTNDSVYTRHNFTVYLVSYVEYKRISGISYVSGISHGLVFMTTIHFPSFSKNNYEIL